MREYNYGSKGKRAVYAIDGEEEFTDEELVKIMRKAIKKSEKRMVRLIVSRHMINTDAWRYVS